MNLILHPSREPLLSNAPTRAHSDVLCSLLVLPQRCPVACQAITSFPCPALWFSFCRRRSEEAAAGRLGEERAAEAWAQWAQWGRSWQGRTWRERAPEEAAQRAAAEAANHSVAERARGRLVSDGALSRMAPCL